jgi:hypothetical protein
LYREGKLISEPTLFAIDLEDDERLLMVHGLNEYFKSAKKGVPFLASLFGATTDSEFRALIWRLLEAIENKEPLSKLDWTRALVLTEICWASDLVGSGLAFAAHFRDEDVIPMLRYIQRLTAHPNRLSAFRDNAKMLAYQYEDPDCGFEFAPPSPEAETHD